METLKIPMSVAEEIGGDPRKADAFAKQNHLCSIYRRIVVGGSTKDGVISSRLYQAIDQLLDVLRPVLVGKGISVCTREGNTLETVPPPEPPLIMEPEQVMYDLTLIAQSADHSKFDVPASGWERHLQNSKTSLEYQQKCVQHVLDDKEQYSRLVGCCAEDVFHSILTKACNREGSSKERRIRLVEDIDCQSGGDTCGIRPTGRGSFIIAGKNQRHTEVDNVVLTGLDPDDAESFLGMYLFEVTTSKQSFGRNSQHSIETFDPFFRGMLHDHEVECDLFNVLIYDPEYPVPNEYLHKSTHERSHNIALPLLSEVNVLAKKTFDALGLSRE